MEHLLFNKAQGLKVRIYHQMLDCILLFNLCFITLMGNFLVGLVIWPQEMLGNENINSKEMKKFVRDTHLNIYSVNHAKDNLDQECSRLFQPCTCF